MNAMIGGIVLGIVWMLPKALVQLRNWYRNMKGQQF